MLGSEIQMTGKNAPIHNQPKGERAYTLRVNRKLPWEEVGEQIGCTPNAALQAARHFARRNGQPWPIKVEEESDVLAAPQPAAAPAPRGRVEMRGAGAGASVPVQPPRAPQRRIVRRRIEGPNLPPSSPSAAPTSAESEGAVRMPVPSLSQQLHEKAARLQHLADLASCTQALRERLGPLQDAMMRAVSEDLQSALVPPVAAGAWQQVNQALTRSTSAALEQAIARLEEHLNASLGDDVS